MGKTNSKNQIDITASFNNEKRRKTLEAIMQKVQKFSPKDLKADILAWMKQASQKERNSSNLPEKKNFHSIFLRFLEALESKFYAEMIHQICYTLQITPLSFEDESIRKKLIHVCLKTAFECDSRGEDSVKISKLKEFFDGWVTINSQPIILSIEPLISICGINAPGSMGKDKDFYVICEKISLTKISREVNDILMDMMYDDERMMDDGKVTQIKRTSDESTRSNESPEGKDISKGKETAQKYTRDREDSRKMKRVKREVKCVRYIGDNEYIDTTEEEKSVLAGKLDQIMIEAKTIVAFLFELFTYVFDSIGLKNYTHDNDCIKQIITRYLFSKDSSLMNLTLYLVRIVKSAEHQIFTEKKQWLSGQPDSSVLNPKVEKKLIGGVNEIDIGFKDDLSKIKRDLNRRLVEVLRIPPKNYRDIISNLRLMAVYLEDLTNRDHYFLAYWAEVLQSWIQGAFEDLELDTKIEFIHIIIKYIESNEMLIFASAIERLHRERLVDNQFFQLFINTMETRLEIHIKK